MSRQIYFFVPALMLTLSACGPLDAFKQIATPASQSEGSVHPMTVDTDSTQRATQSAAQSATLRSMSDTPGAPRAIPDFSPLPELDEAERQRHIAAIKPDPYRDLNTCWMHVPDDPSTPLEEREYHVVSPGRFTYLVLVTQRTDGARQQQTERGTADLSADQTQLLVTHANGSRSEKIRFINYQTLDIDGRIFKSGFAYCSQLEKAFPPEMAGKARP